MKNSQKLSSHIRIFVLMLCSLCSTQAMSLANQLENSPSPYLRMHQSDPVQWQTWGPDILAQAKKENKLIYMSIGYFSCHWCHVMQKESYADKDIGQILNQHYIPVKIDRELRPELDRRMIQFVEKLSGNAGWPLNVFITPEGYPVTGFTYLPKKDFANILLKLSEHWSSKHASIGLSAQQYFEHSETSENQSILVKLPDQHFDKVVDAFVKQAMLVGDDLQGGFGKTNKFPSYPQLNGVFNAIKTSPNIDPEVVDFFKLTLEAMATKHLMDHVNYGFYRYVTDPDWQTPHFEKMLYDNAQLASLYFDAERLWPNQGYADIALKTLKFMDDFLANKQGGYFASLSAVDIHNIEGGAYYWEAVELKQLLTPNEYRLLQQQWGFQDDATDIQSQPMSGIGVANDEHKQSLLLIHKKLTSAVKDAMPVDTKNLASWNALALKAWVRAAQYNGSAMAVSRSQQLYHYIVKAFIKEGGQARKFTGQADAAETTLEDYAQLAHAIQLYALYSQDKQAQKIAQTLVETAFNDYYKESLWRQNIASLIPGDKGSYLVQDGILESPVTLLLETVLLMPNANEQRKKQVNALVKRLTRDILDVPYYYASAIMLRKRHSQ